MKEHWKEVVGFCKYEISTLGRVRHKERLNVLKYTYPYNGYPQVRLSKNEKRSGEISKCVHHLVFTTFVGEREKGSEINHKDRDRRNCALDNLEIIANRKEHGRMHRKVQYKTCRCGKEIPPSRKHCSKKCRHDDIYEKRTCRACGREFEVSRNLIKYRIEKAGWKNVAIYCSNKCKNENSPFARHNQKTLRRRRSITLEQANSIRLQAKNITNISELSRTIGISRGIIRGILSGKTYLKNNP
jgi:hypothetical protein